MTHELKQYVPLLSYRNAKSGDRWVVAESRKNENRTRHWGMCYWEDDPSLSRHGRHTAEFGVITEAMPDFCGGLMIYSPFINTYDEKGAWNDAWAAPGSVPKEEEIPDCTWASFDDKYAINLDVILELEGESHERRKQVETYLYEALAAQVAGELMYHGKRGWMAADRQGGTMCKLISAMGHMGAFSATPVEDYKVSDLGGSVHGGYGGGRIGHTAVLEFWAEEGKSWFNTNSGNTVNWHTGGIHPPGEPEWAPDEAGESRCYNCGYKYDRESYDECPSCEAVDYDDYDDTEGPQFVFRPWDWNKDERAKMNSTEFSHRARRFFWRNG
jgi:hypothetical protein